MLHGRLQLRTGIYHPPYSAKNRITNKNFKDEFTTFTINLLTEHSDNIILGEFNLHVSDTHDTEAVIFTNTCEASINMSLSQLSNLEIFLT